MSLRETAGELIWAITFYLVAAAYHVLKRERAPKKCSSHPKRANR
jgi:hypothetical protein